MRRAALRGVRADLEPRPDRRSTRSTTPPTSTRAIRATTPGTWPPSGPRGAARCCVAGSATPRPESVHADAPAGTAPEGRRTPAAAGRACWTCAVSGPACIPVTAAALANVREEGGKAIVLLNRRGWSNFMSCRACGRRVELPGMRRGAGAAPCRRVPRLPSLRPPRGRPRLLPGLRLHARWRATAPAPSVSPTTWPPRSSTTAPSRLPPRRRRGALDGHPRRPPAARGRRAPAGRVRRPHAVAR